MADAQRSRKQMNQLAGPVANGKAVMGQFISRGQRLAKGNAMWIWVMDELDLRGPDGLERARRGAKRIDARAEINEALQPLAAFPGSCIDIAAMIIPELHSKSSPVANRTPRKAVIHIRITASVMCERRSRS